MTGGTVPAAGFWFASQDAWMAAMQAARPTVRPAERSVPFVIKQPETPTAMMKRTAVLLIRFLKLYIEKNVGRRIPTTIAAPIMKMIIALLSRKLPTDFFSFM